jgi:hypothetical protein
MSAPPALDPNQARLLEMQQVLSSSIEALWRCSQAVDAPSASSPAQLQHDMQQLTIQFKTLTDLSHQFSGPILVPSEVFGCVFLSLSFTFSYSISSCNSFFRHLEVEENPDLVTRAQLLDIRARNDQVRGRQYATIALRDHLAGGLQALDDVPDLKPTPQQP